MRRVLPLLVVALLAGCGGGGDDDESAAPEAAGETIEIRETEFALEPATVKIPQSGTYTFHVVNDGQTTHALEVEGDGAEEETDDIAPGESADLTVELERGEYELYCPIGSHKEQGMEGRLVVGGGSGTVGDAGTTTGDDGY